jgi:putative ABC transport system permease protein
MATLLEWLTRLGATQRPSRRDADLEQELRLHLELATEDEQRRATSDENAARAAAIRSGGMAQAMEALREQRGVPWLDDLVRDVGFGLRVLRRNPSFTVAAVATLALGIGLTTAMFSVVHAVLLRPLPFVEPNRLVELVATKPLESITAYDVSAPDFKSWRERTRSFTEMAALSERDFNLADEETPERVNGMAASVSLWRVLGMQPVAGRTFDPDEDSAGRHRVALVSDGLVRRRYGGDRALIGRTVHLNGMPHVIVGVVPSDMGFARDVDVWVPFVLDPRQSRGDRQLTVIARLKPGVTPVEASAELGSVAAALEREFPASNRGYNARARPLLDMAVSPEIDRALKMLLAGVALLLLVACANVANLVLARAAERGSELALRRALGAGRARLTRQFATESLLLAAVGGASGMLLAAIVVRVAQPTLAPMLPRAWSLSLDLPVLGAAVLGTATTGLAFALIPVWRAMRGDVTEALRPTGRVLSDQSHARVRRGFVVAQISLATMLVIGAALLAQSVIRLMRVEPGFRTDHLLTAGIGLSAGTYPNQESRTAFFRRLIEAVSSVTGVTAVGVVSHIPLRPGAGGPGMEVAPTQASLASARRAHWRIATSGYFQAIGIRLLRGRLFETDERETPGGFRAVIVSESLARRLWPDETDPIGRQVWLGNGQVRTVIGVVGDVHQTGLANGMTPTMYMPPSWVFLTTNVLVVRTAGEPASMASAIRDAVHRVDPQQALFNVRTMDDHLRASAARERLNATLLGAFALLALAVGSVGVAGMVAHAVAQRRPELAVRMALGARASRVMREVVSDGIRLCLYGLVIGLAGAVTLGRALSSFLFGVRPDDPTIFSVAGLTLFTVALAACCLPALRVIRIDPATELRNA